MEQNWLKEITVIVVGLVVLGLGIMLLKEPEQEKSTFSNLHCTIEDGTE